MITTQTMPLTPTRKITAKVELYQGSTLLYTFRYDDFLKSIDIDRAGEANKLFGITIGQTAVIKVIDRNNQFRIKNTMSLRVFFDNGQGFISPLPTLYVSEVVKDAATNEITITAVCMLQKNGHLPISLLEYKNYDTYEFLGLCGQILGLETRVQNINTDDYFWSNVSYDEGANFDDNTTVREALRDYADASQTIVYIDKDNILTVRRLDEWPVVYIDKSQYFNFSIKGEVHIKTLAHITELGDNIPETVDEDGIDYYIYNNAFIENRDDADLILKDAAKRLYDKYYQSFDLDFRGNYLLELGDYFAVKSEYNYYCYLLNDSIKYNGGLTHRISFDFEAREKEYTNPTNLGELLNQTTARVDKVNKEITLRVEEANATNEAMAEMQEEFYQLSSQLKQTAEDIQIEISRIEQNGTSKITTSTNYTFDENGLKISSSGKTETLITDDGMEVSKDGEPVLIANNEGVEAIDLRATTFLIIGKNSRLQDYEGNRTACFWIGG